MQNAFRIRRTYKGPSGNFFAIQNISVNSKPAYDKVFAKIVNGFYPFTIFEKKFDHSCLTGSNIRPLLCKSNVWFLYDT